MREYVERFGGYIADNPNIDFVRCDGRVFDYDEVNTSGFTNGAETLTITGGQGAFPLAYLDTTKTQELTFDISNFDMAMFEMANATNKVSGDYGTLETRRFDVGSGLKITIPYECQAGSVKITGLTEKSGSGELTAGEYKVEITAAAAETAGKTEITMAAADATVGDTIRVSYKRRVVGGEKIIIKTTSTTAKGALYAHFPVYSAGDNCADAAIKAWVHICIPRVRVTALPGFNSSYKQASTYSVTFAGIDPKRADGKMWEIMYEPLDGEGEIVNKSGATVTWD